MRISWALTSTSTATCATCSSAPPRARPPRAWQGVACARRSCASSACRCTRTWSRSPRCVRGAMKPLPTLTKPLRSVDIATHEPAEALRERTDSCTVPAAGVVGEAMVAFVLADAYRAKFGGDHIDDVRQALASYRERIGWLH